MTSPAVVILTEPARCELADPEALMQAVLQVQQLNKAGLAPSQTFCDHPADAMKFIEAYTKAYPELHLRSGDLPPPEKLYSIIADGRVMPLQPPAGPTGAKPGEAGQLYPLYVLTLGAPDALMRALQQNKFANSDIKVLDIAPVEHPSSETLSVAEAVAHERNSFWQSETSARLDHDDDGIPTAGWEASESQKLDSVEVNLDHIQLDSKNGHEDHYERALDEPPPAMVVPPPASASTVDPGLGSSAVVGGLDVSGIGASDSQAPTPSVSATGLEAGAPASLPTGLTGASVGEPNVPLDPGDAAPAGDAGAPEEHADNEGEAPREVPAVAAPEGPLVDGAKPDADDGDRPDGDRDDEHEAGSSEKSASEMATAASVAEQDGSDGRSFSDPGGDVAYSPNDSFAMDNDVTYPLPAGSGAVEDLFARFLVGSGDGEVIDLEAVFGGLSDSLGAWTAALDDHDLRLMTVRDVSHPSLDDVADPSPGDPTYSDPVGQEESDAEHERLPMSHDLDI